MLFQFLKNCKKEANLYVFLKIRFIFVPVIKAFFVYCTVVKEYNSFLNS